MRKLELSLAHLTENMKQTRVLDIPVHQLQELEFSLPRELLLSLFGHLFVNFWLPAEKLAHEIIRLCGAASYP